MGILERIKDIEFEVRGGGDERGAGTAPWLAGTSAGCRRWSTNQSCCDPVPAASHQHLRC